MAQRRARIIWARQIQAISDLSTIARARMFRHVASGLCAELQTVCFL